MTFERVRPEGASPEAGARHTWSPPSADISKGPVPIPMPYYKLSANRKHLPGVKGEALRAAAPGKLPDHCELVGGEFWTGEIARHDRPRLAYAVWSVLSRRLLAES